MRNRFAFPLLVLTLVALVLLGTAGPADAHGDSITFRIDGQHAGHVRTVATWANDGDPVTEEIAATLSAVSTDGNSLGPWILIAVPGATATFTTREALPAGTWKVRVDSGYPALGLGTGTLTVGQGPISDPTNAFPSHTDTPRATASTRPPTQTGTTPSTRTPPTAAGSTTHDAAPAGGIGSSIGTTWIAVASGITLAAAAIAAVVTIRRRRGARSS